MNTLLVSGDMMRQMLKLEEFQNPLTGLNFQGTGRLDGPESVLATHADGTSELLPADIILIATGARPRELPDAPCDGQRILNWTQMYTLTELPRRLIVVGSGVTGAEFASAYNALGVDVVLVSSRNQVLPSEDEDAGHQRHRDEGTGEHGYLSAKPVPGRRIAQLHDCMMPPRRLRCLS